MAVKEDRVPEADARLERRRAPRIAVDCEATVYPVSGAVQLRGRISSLSLSGCLVLTDQRYTAGILVRVEVQFQLRGIVFRAVGVVAGTRGTRGFAVRFLDMPSRRREQLAEAMVEAAAEISSEISEPAVGIQVPHSGAAIAPITK